LDLFVCNISGQFLDFLGEGGDLVGGVLDFVGSIIYSSVILIDFGLTIDFISCVFLVGFLLVQ
jgi:hypothetical protein